MVSAHCGTDEYRLIGVPFSCTGPVLGFHQLSHRDEQVKNFEKFGKLENSPWGIKKEQELRYSSTWDQ